MSSSLSSVVSDLVRAQTGASISSSATDQELDRHVAEIIVREAKKKAELYMQSGVRAYTNNNLIDSNAPKTNKRFLSSIIKSTDEHNKSILKAQAQAAEDLKREKREQERKHRKVRAEEAAAAERRRRNGKRRHTDEDEEWDRWDGRTAERTGLSRNWETWDGCTDDRDLDSDRNESRKRRRSRSRDKVRTSKPKRSRVSEEESQQRRRKPSTSSDRKRSPDRTHDKRHDHQSRQLRDWEDTRRRFHRSESHSRSPSTHSSDTEYRKVKKRKRSRSSKYALDDLHDASSPQSSRRSPLEIDTKSGTLETELNQRSKDSQTKDKSGQGPFHATSASRQSLTPMTISHSPSPGPRPPEHLPSKMDRYFEESYDPRLDVEPLTVPRVPATGLVSDADFESWDAMLELIRLRREDKAEKKRLERLGILPTKDKNRKGVPASSSAAVAERWNAEGVSVMDIEYSKKGTVREWDLGKEGF